MVPGLALHWALEAAPVGPSRSTREEVTAHTDPAPGAGTPAPGLQVRATMGKGGGQGASLWVSGALEVTCKLSLSR